MPAGRGINEKSIPLLCKQTFIFLRKWITYHFFRLAFVCVCVCAVVAIFFLLSLFFQINISTAWIHLCSDCCSSCHFLKCFDVSFSLETMAQRRLLSLVFSLYLILSSRTSHSKMITKKKCEKSFNRRHFRFEWEIFSFPCLIAQNIFTRLLFKRNELEASTIVHFFSKKKKFSLAIITFFVWICWAREKSLHMLTEFFLSRRSICVRASSQPREKSPFFHHILCERLCIRFGYKMEENAFFLMDAFTCLCCWCAQQYTQTLVWECACARPSNLNWIIKWREYEMLLKIEFSSQHTDIWCTIEYIHLLPRLFSCG